MKKDSSRLFWVSYADLMTALFIVALALFVLSYKMFKIRAAALVTTEEELAGSQPGAGCSESGFGRIEASVE